MFRKRGAALTHGWLIGNKVMRWFAWAFLFLVLVILIITATIRAVVEHDCANYYKRDIKVPGYWIHVDVGSTKSGCPGGP
jgi:hypothetical protein